MPSSLRPPITSGLTPSSTLTTEVLGNVRWCRSSSNGSLDDAQASGATGAGVCSHRRRMSRSSSGSCDGFSTSMDKTTHSPTTAQGFRDEAVGAVRPVSQLPAETSRMGRGEGLGADAAVGGARRPGAAERELPVVIQQHADRRVAEAREGQLGERHRVRLLRHDGAELAQVCGLLRGRLGCVVAQQAEEEDDSVVDHAQAGVVARQSRVHRGRVGAHRLPPLATREVAEASEHHVQCVLAMHWGGGEGVEAAGRLLEQKRRDEPRLMRRLVDEAACHLARARP
eukprot:scaffold87602_cov27-Tisochrysis_lutea.AAC.3